MHVPVDIAAAGKIAAKEGVKVAAKEGAKNAAKETAKNVVKEGAKNAAKEGAEDAVKKGAEGIAKQGVENAVKDVGQNAVKNTVEDGFKGKAKDIASDSSKGIPSKVESSSVPAPRSTTGQLKDATVDKVKEKAKDQTRSAIDDVTDRSRSDDSVENDVSGGGEASENLQSDVGKNPDQQVEAGIDPKAALEAAKNIANNPLVKTASKVHPAANAAVNTAANVLNQADKVAKAANTVNAATPNVPKPKSTAGGLAGKPAGATPAPRKKTPAKPKNPVEGAAKKAFDKTPVGKAKKAVDKLSGKDKKANPKLKGSLGGGSGKQKSEASEVAGKVSGQIIKKAALTLVLLLFPALLVVGCTGIIFGLAMGGGSGGAGGSQVLEYDGSRPIKVEPYVKTCYKPSGDSNGSGFSELPGDDTATKVWNYFRSRGFSEAATAGIMGNAYAESGMDPTSEGTGGGGILGFDDAAGVRPALMELAKSRGRDWTDLETQLDFSLDMMPGQFYSDSLTFEQFKEMTDPEEAAVAFEKYFERAGIPALEKRCNAAREYYDQFKGKGVSSSGGSSSSSGGSSGGNNGRLIIIGDSRTVQMYNYMVGSYTDNITGETDGNLFRAKGSMGLAWMKSDAVPYAEEQMKSGDNVVILFGVNDLSNASQYISYVNEKAKEWKGKNVNTYFVSVNPTDDSKAAVKCSQIEEFNNQVKGGLEGVGWIETYAGMKEKNFATDAEGLHYMQDGYEYIYNTIKDSVKNGTSSSVATGDEECSEEDKSEGDGYSGGRQSLASANADQKKVVDVAKNSNSVCLEPDLCLAFAQDVLEEAGFGGQRFCCAHAAMDGCTTHTDLNNIPVGACLFTGTSWGPVMCGCGRDAGHVGIYIGDNQVADNIGGRRICSVDQWVSEVESNGGKVCWGWLNDKALA